MIHVKLLWQSVDKTRNPSQNFKLKLSDNFKMVLAFNRKLNLEI